MITCRKKIPSVSFSMAPVEPVLKKVSQNKMSILFFLFILLLSGLSFAYFMSYLPMVLVSVFGEKHQITSSQVVTTPGTSIVKRSRQQSVPQNSGLPMFLTRDSLKLQY